jgi:hypothetical protein
MSNIDTVRLAESMAWQYVNQQSAKYAKETFDALVSKSSPVPKIPFEADLKLSYNASQLMSLIEFAIAEFQESTQTTVAYAKLNKTQRKEVDELEKNLSKEYLSTMVALFDKDPITLDGPPELMTAEYLTELAMHDARKILKAFAWSTDTLIKLAPTPLPIKGIA